MDAFKDYINGLDFDLPDGDDFSDPEPPAKEEESSRVFVQKLITEIWVYTDLDKKTYGTQTIQDVAVLGEMERDALMAMIGKEKLKRKRRK